MQLVSLTNYGRLLSKVAAPRICKETECSLHFLLSARVATFSPTWRWALIFYDKPRLGGRANYATHKVFEQIMWMAGKSPIRQFWQQEFGRPPWDFGCPYSRQTTAAMPTVVSCSNTVFPRPDDWPEHVHNTGYWFIDGCLRQ